MVRCPSSPCVEEVAMMENRKDCTLRASRSCPLFSAHGAAVGGDIPIVLFHRAGEAMVAGGVSDEIVVIRLCRMHGRFERALAGIGDGPGRKSGVRVSVVRRVEAHVVVMQRAGVGSG